VVASRLHEQNKKLAQEIALIQLQLKELDSKENS
jgi:hypothetical protein